MSLQSNELSFKQFKVRHLILIYLLVSVFIGIPLIMLTFASKQSESASSIYGYFILSMSTIYLLISWRLKNLGIDERKIVGKFSWPTQWKKLSVIWLADLLFSVGALFTILLIASYVSPKHFQDILEGGLPHPNSLFEQTLSFLAGVIIQGKRIKIKNK